MNLLLISSLLVVLTIGCTYFWSYLIGGKALLSSTYDLRSNNSSCVEGVVSVYTSPPYTFDDIPDLSGKIALVTGSNTGIGYITVRELAKRGANVIATTRSIEKGEDALKRLNNELKDVQNRGLVEFLQLDLSSFRNIVQFCKQIKTYPKLDMLILNAGVMFPPFQRTEDRFELQIGTNHLGHFLLVKNLMSMIIESKTRVVTISSCAHYVHYNYNSPVINYDSFTNQAVFNTYRSYGQSKLANILFSNALARRLEGTGATSNSLHPGSIKTDLFLPIKVWLFGTGSNPLSTLFHSFSHIVEDALLLQPDEGALTQLYVATSPALNETNGKYFEPIAVMRSPSSYALNEEYQEDLWKMSEKLTEGFW